MRLKFWQSKTAATTSSETPKVVLVPESHCGQHGYTVFENSQRKGWGPTQDAAIAAYQVSQVSKAG